MCAIGLFFGHFEQYTDSVNALGKHEALRKATSYWYGVVTLRQEICGKNAPRVPQ